jgi:hypothetical protein
MRRQAGPTPMQIAAVSRFFCAGGIVLCFKSLVTTRFSPTVPRRAPSKPLPPFLVSLSTARKEMLRYRDSLCRDCAAGYAFDES